jgi:hypothetical protein
MPQPLKTLALAVSLCLLGCGDGGAKKKLEAEKQALEAQQKEAQAKLKAQLAEQEQQLARAKEALEATKRDFVKSFEETMAGLDKSATAVKAKAAAAPLKLKAKVKEQLRTLDAARANAVTLKDQLARLDEPKLADELAAKANAALAAAKQALADLEQTLSPPAKKKKKSR